MAAIPEHPSDLEYELCYFDDGSITTITIFVHNRQEAMNWYVSEALFPNWISDRNGQYG
ncbi:RNA helicase [Vibrio crassostreae]|uniref:RNA helicase n=1 Tax=Vibrio crassostreae TaxID=246167 RepID=UPI00352E9F05